MIGSQLMDWDEHIMLISHTVNVFGRNLLVIGNTGSNSTREALHATEQGFAVGMHASLQINPYYGKTSMPGAVRGVHVDAMPYAMAQQEEVHAANADVCCLFITLH